MNKIFLFVILVLVQGCSASTEIEQEYKITVEVVSKDIKNENYEIAFKIQNISNKPQHYSLGTMDVSKLRLSIWEGENRLNMIQAHSIKDFPRKKIKILPNEFIKAQTNLFQKFPELKTVMTKKILY